MRRRCDLQISHSSIIGATKRTRACLFIRIAHTLDWVARMWRDVHSTRSRRLPLLPPQQINLSLSNKPQSACVCVCAESCLDGTDGLYKHIHMHTCVARTHGVCCWLVRTCASMLHTHRRAVSGHHRITNCRRLTFNSGDFLGRTGGHQLDDAAQSERMGISSAEHIRTHMALTWDTHNGKSQTKYT